MEKPVMKKIVQIEPEDNVAVAVQDISARESGLFWTEDNGPKRHP